MPKSADHVALAKCRVSYLGYSTVAGEVPELGTTEFLQAPLKERYPKNKTGINAYLTVFSSGLYMQCNDSPNTVVWYPINRLYMCAAVRYVDKQSATAEELVDSFVPLDDARGSGPHSPIFALAIRRHDNKDKIECHVFITKNTMAAMALVHSCTHAFQDKDGWRDTMPPAHIIDDVLRKGFTVNERSASKEYANWKEGTATSAHISGMSQYESSESLFDKTSQPPTVSRMHGIPPNAASVRSSSVRSIPAPQSVRVPPSQRHQMQMGGTVSVMPGYRPQSILPHRFAYPAPRHPTMHARPAPPNLPPSRMPATRAPHPYWTIGYAGPVGYPYPYPYGPLDIEPDARKDAKDSKKKVKGKDSKKSSKIGKKEKVKDRKTETHGSPNDVSNTHPGQSAKESYQTSEAEYETLMNRNMKRFSDHHHSDRNARGSRTRDMVDYKEGQSRDRFDEQNVGNVRRSVREDRSPERREDKRSARRDHSPPDRREDRNPERREDRRSARRDHSPPEQREHRRSARRDHSPPDRREDRTPERLDCRTADRHEYRSSARRDDKKDDSKYRIQQIGKTRSSDSDFSSGETDSDLSDEGRDHIDSRNKRQHQIHSRQMDRRHGDDEYELRRERDKSEIDRLAHALAEHRVMNKTPPVDYENDDVTNNADDPHSRSKLNVTPPADYEEVNDRIAEAFLYENQRGFVSRESATSQGGPLRYNSEIFMKAGEKSTPDIERGHAQTNTSANTGFRWPYQ